MSRTVARMKLASYLRPGYVQTSQGNGKGFDVVIPDGISVSGRIVCTEAKNKDATE